MKIDTEYLDDQQVKLTVEVEAESLESAKRRAARIIASRTKIPGFRPGKAPYNIVQRHVGEEALLEEGLEILVNDLYPQLLEESKLQPFGPGRFEGLKSLDPLTLEFVIPLMAEVQLGDYRSLRFPYAPPQISEQQVDEVIQNLRERQADETPTDRPAVEGDRVNIRLSARRRDQEGESEAVLIRERPLSVVIPQDQATSEEDDDEWPYPGFSRQLIGLAAGEHKTLEYTFPEDPDFETLQGVTAQLEVELEEVKSRTLPDLDDSFAKSIGKYENLEALRKEIRESLHELALEAYNAEYDDQVVNAAVEQSTIKYPPQLLEHEIDEVIEQLEQRLKAQSLDLETYRKTRNIDEQDLREEARPVAETRVKRSLVLFEIADAEDIQVEKEELQTETERTLDAMTRFMSESELKKMSTKNLLQGLVGNILVEMRINRTLERLRDIARGEQVEDRQRSPEEGEGEGSGEIGEVEVRQSVEGARVDNPEAIGPANAAQMETPTVEDKSGEEEPDEPNH